MLRAIIFDFDGVILDSVGIKTKAFARLFEEHGPDVVRKVVEHHTSHGGISRFRKFQYIYEKILRQPMPEGELERLGDRFSALVFDEVVKAAWIPGAEDFLRQNHKRYKCFVASGTPEDELRRIVEIRQLARYFWGVYGSPAKKELIATRILTENKFKTEELVLIGDAMTDYDAAKACGLRFIGIDSAKTAPFPSGAEVLPDLTSLSTALGGDR